MYEQLKIPLPSLYFKADSVTNSTQQTPTSLNILKNFSFLSIGRVLGDVFTFLLFVTLTRTYGESGIGNYSYAMAYMGFFAIFADFGLYHYSAKEMSKLNVINLEHFNLYFSLRLFLTVLIFLSLVLSAIILNHTRQLIYIISTLGLYQLLWQLIQGLTALNVSRKEMLVPSAIEFVLKVIIAVSGVGLCIYKVPLHITLLSFPISSLLCLFITYYLTRKNFGKLRFIFDLKKYYATLKHSKPYFESEFLRVLSTRIDILIISFVLSTTAAGIYNVSYRVVLLFLFISYFGSVAIFPHASNSFVHAKHKLSELYENSLNTALLIATPISAGIWLLSDEIILLLFGNEFINSVIILKYLTWLIFILSLSSIMGIFMISTDKQKVRAKCQWLTAFINVIGNLILIPKIGILGAAIATLFSESILLILYAINLKNTVGLPLVFERALISASGSILFIIIFSTLTDTNIVVTILVSILIYITYICLFKSIRKHEIIFLKKLLYKND